MNQATSPAYEAIMLRFQERIQRTINEFIQMEVSGSVVLLIATVAAMILANSPWADQYAQFWQTKAGFRVGEFEFYESLQHWINDFLMAFFFFVVGLEIKREILIGELSSLRKAALPLMAAVGGMLVPAALYLALNAGGKGEHGWGVPMATDIAFALGVVALLGSRAPTSLKVFLTALAIADDIGAVLVIAVFYTEQLDLNWLAIGLGFLLLLFFFLLIKQRSRLVFLAVALVIWFAFFESGIHATLAGVLVAFAIPCRMRRRPLEFVPWARGRLEDIERLHEPDAHPLASAEEQAIARALEKAAHETQSPLHRLEHQLHPITAFLIVPLFALANAGIPLLGSNVLDLLVTPVSLGIILGLIIGKQVGITLFAFVTVKLGLADLPEGLSWKQIYGASWLGGIGFTMSLFVASLAFGNAPLLAQAKLAILVASLIAGLGGFLVLRLAGSESLPSQESQPNDG